MYLEGAIILTTVLSDFIYIKVIGIFLLLSVRFWKLNGSSGKCGPIFEVVFLLYSLFYPIYWLVAGDVLTGFSAVTMAYSLNLYMYFLTFYMLAYKAYKYYSKVNSDYAEIQKIQIKVEVLIAVLVFFMILYSYAAVQVITSGGLTKSERMTSGTASFQTFHGAIYLLVGALYTKFRVGIKRRKIKLLYIFLLIYLLGLYPILNERDEVILPIAHVLIMMYLYKDITSKHLKMAGVFLVLVFTIFGYIRSLSDEDFNLLFALGQNEFIFSVRNMAYVVENNITMEQGTIIGDITSMFGWGQTGVSWFNAYVYENKGMGVVVEMYLNFGEWGVILIGLIYGVVVGYIDMNRKLKHYSVVIFKSLIFLALLYSIRSDFAIITTTFFKKYLIMVAILSLISRIKYNEGE